MGQPALNKSWQRHPARVTSWFTCLSTERDQWREFLAQYGLTVNIVLGRAMRMMLYTIRRYPHTPIARELLKPQWQSKWDQPLPDKLSISDGPINNRSDL